MRSRSPGHEHLHREPARVPPVVRGDLGPLVVEQRGAVRVVDDRGHLRVALVRAVADPHEAATALLPIEEVEVDRLVEVRLRAERVRVVVLGLRGCRRSSQWLPPPGSEPLGIPPVRNNAGSEAGSAPAIPGRYSANAAASRCAESPRATSASPTGLAAPCAPRRIGRGSRTIPESGADARSATYRTRSRRLPGCLLTLRDDRGMDPAAEQVPGKLQELTEQGQLAEQK